MRVAAEYENRIPGERQDPDEGKIGKFVLGTEAGEMCSWGNVGSAAIGPVKHGRVTRFVAELHHHRRDLWECVGGGGKALT